MKAIKFLALFLLVCSPAYAVSSATCFDTDTVLMIPGDGTDASTTIPDTSVSAKTVTAVANAQIDTAQKKFGSASVLMDGTGDYLSIADSADWDYGTGDFTIDFWFKFNTEEAIAFYDTDGVGVGTLGMRIAYAGGNIEVNIQNNNYTFAVGGTFGTSDFQHLAITRASGNLRVFHNGAQLGTTQTSTENISGSGNALLIGEDGEGSVEMDGWFDEYRVVKGTAVWTSNFTSPTAAYSSTCASVGGSTATQGAAQSINSTYMVI